MSNEKTPDQKDPAPAATPPSRTDMNNFDDADKLPNDAPGPDGPPPDYDGKTPAPPDLEKLKEK